MPAILNRYATPLITGLFLVSLVSGIALFFHWGSAWFHGMHEWLSMVLIVPFGLHIWKNWRPMSCYLKRAPMALALALSLVAALAFALPSVIGPENGARRGPPQFAIAQALFDAPLSEAAPVLGMSGTDAAAKLGATVTQSLTEIATAQDSSAAALAEQLMVQP
ncbi:MULTISPECIES: DUF4405 domain-containing protein [unclassified Thioclava]|uniref:DUF4405 domain-containing protein n=1 Tax=unclassified Thioclava TaxID=2621713 RepID=UPI000B5408FD|nr:MULTISPECIES: DUF4405 domain-containing protein [unclassified Thioclava]OWX99736.1 DUF4405 domain-containing protein [Thioclava sp. IC9]OWY09467.1 DUF4405 domain-containing protein [Thioclava sp. F42-5]